MNGLWDEANDTAEELARQYRRGTKLAITMVIDWVVMMCLVYGGKLFVEDEYLLRAIVVVAAALLIFQISKLIYWFIMSFAWRKALRQHRDALDAIDARLRRWRDG